MKKRFLVFGLVVAIAAIGLLWRRDSSQSQTPNRTTPVQATESTSPKRSDRTSRRVNSEKTGRASNPKEILKTGGFDFTVVFEGSETLELKKLILSDLNLVFGQFQAYEFVAPNETLINRGDGSIPVAGQINFTGGARHIPKDLLEAFGGYTGDPSSPTLIVSQQVIDVYKAALARLAPFEKEVSSLPDFVSRINTLASNPPSDVSQIVYWDSKEMGGFGGSFGVSDVVKSFGAKRYRQPSLLELQTLQGQDSPIDATLTAPLYLIVDQGLSDGAPAIIYESGQWKFFLSGKTL